MLRQDRHSFGGDKGAQMIHSSSSLDSNLRRHLVVFLLRIRLQGQNKVPGSDPACESSQFSPQCTSKKIKRMLVLIPSSSHTGASSQPCTACISSRRVELAFHLKPNVNDLFPNITTLLNNPHVRGDGLQTQMLNGHLCAGWGSFQKSILTWRPGTRKSYKWR